MRDKRRTRDDVLKMVAFHFNLQRPANVKDRTDVKLRAKFDEIVSKLVNTSDSTFGTYFNSSSLDMFTNYSITRDDLFYLAALGILRGPPGKDDLLSFNETSVLPLVGEYATSDRV